MFKSKLLSNLTKLDASECHRFEDFVSLDGIRELANCEHMTNLKSLIFLANDIDDECCKLIATSPYLKNLTELDCSECHEIGLVGNEYLVNSENCKNMRIFKLESCHNENMIGAFKVIATGKYFSNLTDLTISDLMTKEEKLEDLSRFTQLKSLNVSMNSYSNIKALTRNEYVNYLTSLNLSNNSLGREGCMDIANCKHLNQLTYLNLSDNDIGVKGLVDLCNSPNMINLKSLIISYNSCTQQSCKYLCESKYITNLTFLDISNNRVKRDGVKMIAQSSNLANLNRLYVEECDCDDSFTIISNSQFANQLKILNIDNIDWNLRDKFNSLEKLVISTLNVDSMGEIIVLFEILPKLQTISNDYNGRDLFQRDAKSGEIIPTELGLNLLMRNGESEDDESDEE